MTISAADFDVVFEALLDRTAYLNAKGRASITQYNFGTSATSHLTPSGARLTEVIAIGGGGGGGGAVAGTSGGGGGGSSGGWARALIAPNSELLIRFEIGVGGTGGATGATGSPGGNTRVVAHSAFGGDPFAYAGWQMHAPGGAGGLPSAATAGALGGGRTFGDLPPNVTYARGSNGTNATAAGLSANAATADCGYNVPGGTAAGFYTAPGTGWGAGGGGAAPALDTGGVGGQGGNGAGGLDLVGAGFPAQAIAGTGHAGGKGAGGALVIIHYFAENAAATA